MKLLLNTWGQNTFCRKTSKIDTINLQLSPPAGLFILSLFEAGGLFEREGLFNLEMTMVSVLHKELTYKVEKLKYKKF